VTWGRAGSPLRVDDLVVVPYGGRAESSGNYASLIALDALDGSPRWTGGTTQISYASPVLATLAGVRQILSVNEDDVTGHDPRTGAVLWSHPWPGSSTTGANVSNPAPVGDDRVLLSKGYGGGGMLLRLNATAEGLDAESLWHRPSVLKTKFTNVSIDGEVAYGLSDGWLQAVDLVDGRQRWRQGRASRFGHGHLLRAGDTLVVLSEEGEVALVAADPQDYRELARMPVLAGKTWNPPALAGRLLVIRNAREAVALELPER
jgi:outer membrane protein assembly factor BamB